MRFQLQSEYSPKGDQPQAIEALVRGLSDGAKDQVLLGITGSGKTSSINCESSCVVSSQVITIQRSEIRDQRPEGQMRKMSV